MAAVFNRGSCKFGLLVQYSHCRISRCCFCSTLGNMSRNKRKHKNKRERKDTVPHKPYEDIVVENKDFETFYKLQKICAENEWERFLQTLRSDLPASFRITGSKSEAKTLLKVIQGQYFKDIMNVAQESEGFKEPIAVPWYPDNLAWQLKLSRKDIRSEPFFRLQSFLISETDSGNISRQEVVSMIPPIALDVKSHHKILDMCASPGSKTAQLIEYLHKDEERLPKGFVIANDIDNNRCYMLVHQAKRLNSPNIVITNHDAAIMPNFITKKEDGSEDFLKFDRILCDVPCTGDGTLRKHADIWTKWNSVNGNNLHGVQFRIIKRGVEMLAIGGRIVYSTCSLNPLEDEAVISRILLEAKGSLKLVDLAPTFPGLIYSKGMNTWVVTSRDMAAYKSFEEVPEKWHTVVRPQMFPPPPDKVEELHLDRCIRILPHQQDTGGFFVAALEKTGPLPWESGYSKEPSGDNQKVEVKEPSRKKRRIFGYKEDPYIFFDENEAVWKEIKDFYDLSDELPVSCLLTRCKEEKKNNIYLTTPQVREIVTLNSSKFKIINTGVKAFARRISRNVSCSFRLAQEGLWSIYPFIGEKRKVRISKEDLLLLLYNHDSQLPPEISLLKPETQNVITAIGAGSCVFVYDEEPITEDSLHLQLVGWLGAVSAKAFVAHNDCVHFIRLLGGDTTKFDLNRSRKTVNEPVEEKENESSNMEKEESEKNNDS